METASFSPATQAVLDAYDSAPFVDFDIADRVAIAAVLRTVADQVVPDDYSSYSGHTDWDQGLEARNDSVRDSILSIAAELEGSVTRP